VPGFDIRQLLGRKNTRAMDRITGLTVLAVGALLGTEPAAGNRHGDGTTGLVLGTTNGSVQTMMDFTRDSFTQDKPYLVDPARFPYSVMNCAAGQSAIWHRLRGPNTTIASGQVAGLAALSYGARLHRFGHVASVVCGATEELTGQRVWLERQRQDGSGSAPLGEGCAVFRLEAPTDARAAGRPIHAYLLATAFRVYPHPDAVSGVVADCASSVLKAAGAGAEEVWVVAADLPEAQAAGLAEVVGGRPRWIHLTATLGDTGAASAAFQVAAVLSHASVDHTASGRLALVASVDRDGLAGVAALRLSDPSAEGGTRP
jgi:3-oxoacyl-[acyl-carrier-protein] synthase II